MKLAYREGKYYQLDDKGEIKYLAESFYPNQLVGLVGTPLFHDHPDLKENPMPIYPPFELVQTIANACLKHSDSGEASVNKEARIVLQALEDAGYTITKKQTT